MLTQEILAVVSFVAEAVWKTWPAFLISVAMGVMIKELNLDRSIRHAFTARPLPAVFLSTLFGAFSPFCSCTVIPVINGLLMSGVPLAPVMAFWIASPTMDPEIFALSTATIGWPLALTRLGATLVLSLGGGLLTLFLNRRGILTHNLLRQDVPAQSCCAPAVPSAARPGMIPLTVAASPAAEPCCAPAAPARPSMIPLTVAASPAAEPCCAPAAPALPSAARPSMIPLTVAARPAAEPCCAPAASSCCTPAATTADTASEPQAERSGQWRAALAQSLRTLEWPKIGREIARQSYLLGRWLVLAFVLEALIERYLPQAAIAGVLGTSSIIAVPLAALIGVPLYLHSVSALPIVSGLLAQGMQPGAAIAFLIAGPVTTIPAMTAVWGVVNRRVFALYLAIGMLGAIAMGVITNIIFSLLRLWV